MDPIDLHDAPHRERRRESDSGLSPAVDAGIGPAARPTEAAVLRAHAKIGNRAVGRILGPTQPGFQRSPKDDKTKSSSSTSTLPQGSIFAQPGAVDPLTASITGQAQTFGPVSPPQPPLPAPGLEEPVVGRPTKSKDFLTSLTGPTDLYGAPIGEEPVELMAYNAVVDEITALESWTAKRRQTLVPVAQRLRALRARMQVLVTPATRKERKAAGASVVKPRSLTEPLDLSKMSRDEMTTELDLIVAYLRMSPTKADKEKLTGPVEALENALGRRRMAEEEAVRQRDIAIALTPGGDTISDFGFLMKAIQNIAPDPDQADVFLLHAKSSYIPLSKEEVDAVRAQVSKTIKEQVDAAVYLYTQAYDGFKDRQATNREHPIVHGLVKWSTGVDDLEDLEMFGEQQRGVSRGKDITLKELPSGRFVNAFFDTASLQNAANYYAQLVGQWEADLLGGARRWVIGLTILKEGLTLLATGGASALTAFRVARGASLLKTTLQVGGTLGVTGGIAAGGASLLTQVGSKEGVSFKKTAKAVGVGVGEGGMIGFGGGAATGAKNLLGVGETTVGLSRTARYTRTALAEAGSGALIQTPGALLKGESVPGALAGSLLGGGFSGAGGVLLKDLAKGRKAFELGGGALLGSGSALTLGLAQGKGGSELAISTAFGGLGGAFGAHVERSNRAYLERTYPGLTPPTMPSLTTGADTIPDVTTTTGTGIGPKEPATPVGADTIPDVAMPGTAITAKEPAVPSTAPVRTGSAGTLPAGAPPKGIGSADTAAPGAAKPVPLDAETGVGAGTSGVVLPSRPAPPKGRPLVPESQVPHDLTPTAKPAVDLDMPRDQFGKDAKKDITAHVSSTPTATYSPEEPGRYTLASDKVTAGISAGDSYVVHDALDNNKKHLFKPIEGELPVERAEERGIRAEEQAPREVASSIVAEEIKVPAPRGRLVTIRNQKGVLQKGVLIEWKEKNTLRDLAIADPTAFKRLVNSAEFKRAMTSLDALDYLINNLDRHMNFGNYVYEFLPNGDLKLTAIDHGLTFTSTKERADVTGYTRDLPDTYPPDLVTNLTTLEKNRAAVSERIRAFVGDEAVVGFNHRLDVMLRDMRAKTVAQP